MSDVQSKVEYRDIQGFPGYRVGNDGTVWTRRRSKTSPWKKCALYRRPYGSRYVVVCMRAELNGKVSCHYAHRLVLEAFVGPCPEGMLCRHFPDRDTSNNSLPNLQWGTQQENMDDKHAHGTATKTHCKNGHEFTDDNTYIRPSNGARNCLLCRDKRSRENRKGPSPKSWIDAHPLSDKYGFWTPTGFDQERRYHVLVVCKCGAKSSVGLSELRLGKSQGCPDCRGWWNSPA